MADEPDDFDWFADTFHVGRVFFLTIGLSGPRGFMVSVRRTSADGWEVYYGENLKETCQRAINHGPQYLVEDDDFGGLV